MTEQTTTPEAAPLPAPVLLARSLGAGLGFGFIAAIMVPAWVCLVGIPLSALAGVSLMRFQLRLALPGAQAGQHDARESARTLYAGTWVFVGVAGYIAAVACGGAFALRTTGLDPSSSSPSAALALGLAGGYCLAATPFAFVPLVLLDARRSLAFTDVLVTSVGLATRHVLPLLGGALLAGLLLGLPLWLATAFSAPGWLLVWLLAPWLTSGMLVQRYARLSPTLPLDPREGALPTAGVLLLALWAALATVCALGLASLGTWHPWLQWSGPTPGLLVAFCALALAWIAVAAVLVRAWTRARAVRWALHGGGRETKAFTGELVLHDGAALHACRDGVQVEGGVWVVGRDARVQIPPGVYPTRDALELRPGALAAGATTTVVGRFAAIAQPGLRGASLAWPPGASLLVGDYAEARATLARRATRWTIALLLPLMLLATITAGAIMLDAPPGPYAEREGDW